MTVGGIGCGTVYLSGDGRLYVWDILNQFHEGVVVNWAPQTPEMQKISGNNRAVPMRNGANYVSPPTPDRNPGQVVQGFGLRVGDQFKRMEENSWENILFRGDWPVGRVQYSDPSVPVEVSLNAYSPFIPLNLNDSALPLTVMEYTLTNTSSEPVTASMSGWLDNVAGINSKKKIEIQLSSQDFQRDHLSILFHEATTPIKAQAKNNPKSLIIFADFEGITSYGDWSVEGTAFGENPVHKNNVPSYQGNLNIEGERAANSHASAPGADMKQKDAQKGILTSPKFIIERDYIQFLIGGGAHEGKPCLNLIVDGQIVESATGKNSNLMEWTAFDVSQWQGREAQLVLVDDQSGGWGNIGVDQIIFTDEELSNELDFSEQGDYGNMALGVLDPHAKKIRQENIPGWESTVQLKAGESKTITFFISWYFPNLYDMPGFIGEKNYYSSRFSDAKDVMLYAAGNYDRLQQDTYKWVDTWYDSTLPEWMMDRTVLTANTLQTANCWIFEDGQFWAWEGVGACPGTCTHVWMYAQGLARLFPSLERNLREVTDFGYAQHDNGMIQFRGVNNHYAVDGQAGNVLRTLREHQMSADDAFLKRVWPDCKRALQGLMTYDSDGDGLLDRAQHNTLDAAWFGKVAWLSGLYLSAVSAGEEMALEMGDADFAGQCRQILETGRKNLVDELYSPERGYFINIIDPNNLNAVNSGTGCHIDQVFGQSWAYQVGLDRVMPEEETHSALRRLWEHNFIPDVGPYRLENNHGRWYALPGEAGLVMCTFPTPDWNYTKSLGGENKHAWSAMYFNECMTGFEYQVASQMVYENQPDLVQKGLAITRAIHDRYNPAKRNPYNEIECSDHYARAAASYGVFLAACGFEYHGPGKRIGFAPRVSPEDFRVPFSVAEGWGTYSQKQSGKSMTAELELTHGKLSLRTIVLRLPEGATPKSAEVKLGGKSVPCTVLNTEERAEIQFDEAVVLSEGQSINVSL